MYAKLENNKITYAPRNYNTGDNIILNFNKSTTLMKQYGFKEVIDNKPEYDNSTQYLSIHEYVEYEDTILINYKINKIEHQDPHPTLEEQISDINEVLDITLLATDEIFTLIEPLLPEELSNNLQSRVLDRLLDMYAVMIHRGLKSKDEISDKYKDRVVEILNTKR